jgi:xanthine dehydrogenase accessory factor
MNIDKLAGLNAARAARRGAVVITNLSTGDVDVLLEDDMVGHPLSSVAMTALHGGKAMTVDVEGTSLFLNPHRPSPRIVVIGAVHISQALARMVSVTGHDLTIIDPRTAFATEDRFSGVRLIADWPEEVFSLQPLDRHTAVAAVTHDPKIDDLALSEALKANCFYVGALGSRKTHAKRIGRLREMGHDEEEIGRIRAPIGLDIGAMTPAEIALSILAEIVQCRRRQLGPGGR